MGIFKNRNIEEENEAINVPKVVCDNKELLARIGFWNEALCSDKARRCIEFSIFDCLDNDKLKKVHIPKALRSDIELKFGQVLLGCGVSPDEECVLDDLDSDNFSFRCHLNKENKDTSIKLTWGDPIDEPAGISYTDGNVTSTYEYFPKIDELNLRDYTVEKGENLYNRYLSTVAAYFRLNNGDYNLNITVARPNDFGYYTFRLNNEEELQQYLLGLTFPIDISEVYKNFIQITGMDLEVHPSMDFEVRKDISKNEGTMTDKITVSRGKMYYFLMTKDGRSVGLDKDGNWYYDSPKIRVKNDSDGKIEYSLKMDSYDELEENLSVNQYGIVSEDVDNIKQLVRSLFK